MPFPKLMWYRSSYWGQSLLAPILEFGGQRLWCSVGLLLPMALSSAAMEMEGSDSRHMATRSVPCVHSSVK